MDEDDFIVSDDEIEYRESSESEEEHSIEDEDDRRVTRSQTQSLPSQIQSDEEESSSEEEFPVVKKRKRLEGRKKVGPVCDFVTAYSQYNRDEMDLYDSDSLDEFIVEDNGEEERGPLPRVERPLSPSIHLPSAIESSDDGLESPSSEGPKENRKYKRIKRISQEENEEELKLEDQKEELEELLADEEVERSIHLAAEKGNLEAVQRLYHNSKDPILNEYRKLSFDNQT